MRPNFNVQLRPYWCAHVHVPYSGKFSRVQNFAESPRMARLQMQKKFSRFEFSRPGAINLAANFRGSRPIRENRETCTMRKFPAIRHALAIHDDTGDGAVYRSTAQSDQVACSRRKRGLTFGLKVVFLLYAIRICNEFVYVNRSASAQCAHI